jgi:uncharacterized protein YdiU (UPF0061 family)
MSRNLTGYEKETIINFNEAEDKAYISTYNKSWQRHLEGKLGLKPVMDNGYGGKEYELPKKRIRLPLSPKRLSEETKKKLAKNLTRVAHRNRVLSAETANALAKSEGQKRKQYDPTLKQESEVGKP